MHALNSLLVVVSVVAVAACAAPEPRTSPSSEPFFGTLTRKPCHGADCNIKITVKANCTITLDPDVTEVVEASVTDRTKRKMVWTIVDSPDFRFSNDNIAYGIVIQDYDAKREFEKPKREDTTFTLDFNNTFRRGYPGYKYAVNVVHRNGTVCRSADPWVVN